VDIPAPPADLVGLQWLVIVALVVTVVLLAKWMVKRLDKQDTAQKLQASQQHAAEATCRAELAAERNAREKLGQDFRTMLMSNQQQNTRALTLVADRLGTAIGQLDDIAETLELPARVKDDARQTPRDLATIQGI
jgi:putative heme degradation protein